MLATLSEGSCGPPWMKSCRRSRPPQSCRSPKEEDSRPNQSHACGTDKMTPFPRPSHVGVRTILQEARNGWLQLPIGSAAIPQVSPYPAGRLQRRWESTSCCGRPFVLEVRHDERRDMFL